MLSVDAIAPLRGLAEAGDIELRPRPSWQTYAYIAYATARWSPVRATAAIIDFQLRGARWRPLGERRWRRF